MPAHKKPMNREILYKMYEYEPCDIRYSSREITEFLGCYKGTSRKWLLGLKKQGIVNETGVTNNPLKPLSRDENPNAASNKNEWFLTDKGIKAVQNELYGILSKLDESDEPEEWFFFMKDLYYKQTDYEIPEKSMKYLEYLNLVQDYGDGTFELLDDGVEYVESVLDNNSDNTDFTAREVLYEMYEKSEYKTAVEIAYFIRYIIPAAQELIIQWVDEGVLEDYDDMWGLTDQGNDKIGSELFNYLHENDPDFEKYLKYLHDGKAPIDITPFGKSCLKYFGYIEFDRDEMKWIITQDGFDFLQGYFEQLEGEEQPAVPTEVKGQSVEQAGSQGQSVDKIEIDDLEDDEVNYLLRVLYEQPIEENTKIEDDLYDFQLLDCDDEGKSIISDDDTVDALVEYENRMQSKYKGYELLEALVASPKDVKDVSWHWDERIVNMYIANGFIERIGDVLHVTEKGNPNNWK